MFQFILLVKLIHNLLFNSIKNPTMSEGKEIEALFKVSQVLLKAFEQIHQITGQLVNRNKQNKQEKHQDEKKKPVNNESSQKKEDKKPIKKDNPASQASEKSKEQKKPKKEQVTEKIQEKESQVKKQKKQRHPDHPKHPLTPYFRFNNSSLDKIKSEYPNLSQTQLTSISGMLWKNLTKEQKEPYDSEYQAQKKKYDEALQKFYSKHPEQRPKRTKK